MENWHTIHVFGYGESQIISKESNRKMANTKLTTINPLLSFLASKQQDGTIISLGNLHALNIINNTFIDYVPFLSKDNKRQRFAWKDVDAKLVDDIAADIDKNAYQSGRLPMPKFQIPVNA